MEDIIERTGYVPEQRAGSCVVISRSVPSRSLTFPCETEVASRGFRERERRQRRGRRREAKRWPVLFSLHSLLCTPGDVGFSPRSGGRAQGRGRGRGGSGGRSRGYRRGHLSSSRLSWSQLEEEQEEARQWETAVESLAQWVGCCAVARGLRHGRTLCSWAF